MDSVATSRDGTLSKKDGLSRSKAISIELRRVARTARVARPVSSGGGGFRARRGDLFYRRFFIGSFIGIFVLPVLLGGIYLFAIASNQYVVETRFSVGSGGQNDLEALASLSSILDTTQASDGQIIAEYVRSRSVVEELEKTLNLRRMFSPGKGDFLAEAPEDISMEKFVDYWTNQVKLDVNRSSGLVTLQVRTFSPEDSLVLSKELVQITETMVNRLTRRNEQNSLQEAARELDLSKKRLEGAVTNMRDARIAAGVIDVDLTASSFSNLLTQLNIELSKVETQIETIRKNDVQTPQLVSLKARAAALQGQISTYENRMAGRPNGDRDSKTLAAQASVLADKEMGLTIAQSEYKRAVAAYESARLTMERQRSYLMVYVQPTLPEESLYPQRGFIWIAITFLSFLAWALVAGTAILVRDNTAS